MFEKKSGVMAEEEPQSKKLKPSVISDFIYTDNFQQLFTEHWHNCKDVKLDNLEIISEPFRVCRISNFLYSEDVMDEIKNELLDVKCRRNCLDLYQFEQTSDFVNIDSEYLRLLYQTFQTDLTVWMERITKVELNRKVSMSSSCYYDTDYLLCHDDNMGDRRIAFVLYLSKNWSASDGGALDLFDTDENGLPRNVVKSLIPEYNSLVFFEVTDNSYHQVAEVIASDKSRWSINGWFHGPLREDTRPPRPEIEPNYIQPLNDRINLRDWVTECYIYPSIVKEVQKEIERDSFTLLSNYFKDDVYEKLSIDLTSDSIVWKKVGPADIRNYEVADETSLPELLSKFYNMFKSITIFQLLKDYTELDLISETETMNPKMAIELQRWSSGCYTLLADINERRSSNYGRLSQTEEIPEVSSLEVLEKSREDQEKTSANYENKSMQSESNTPESVKGDNDIDEDEILKKILKEKSSNSKKKLSRQSSLSKLDSLSPQKLARSLDTDDSDVSDIGDYLSDPLDNSLENSDQENLDDANTSDTGALDVIIQFNTNHMAEEEYTIDYVNPKQLEGTLIHVPTKDNHLCLVYKTLSTCRVHKYVTHYCTDYFYNLICTYYE